MTQNQVGDLEVGRLRSVDPRLANDSEFFPGMRKQWGLSFLINPVAGPDGRSAGSVGWAGMANTFYWIDPSRKISGALATQILPFFDETAVALFQAFERRVYATTG
jgi:CubicO group peptidase (beta-lactamase class C family)